MFLKKVKRAVENLLQVLMLRKYLILKSLSLRPVKQIKEAKTIVDEAYLFREIAKE